MKLNLLIEAIQANVKDRIVYLNENSISINGKHIDIAGNLVHLTGYAFRYSSPKDFLCRLRDNGILFVTEATMTQVLKTYNHLDIKPFIKQRNGKKDRKAGKQRTL